MITENRLFCEKTIAIQKDHLFVLRAIDSCVNLTQLENANKLKQLFNQKHRDNLLIHNFKFETIEVKPNLSKLKTELQISIELNMIDYVSGGMDASDFIDKHIRKFINVTDSEEETITDLLKDCKKDWDNAPCDAEGVTPEQSNYLDRIVENCARNISELF